MPSPFLSAGASPEPSKYAPLYTNRFWSGLWTNRNPLRDGATPFLYEKFYSGTRFEALIGGNNMELTSKLTMGRSPGFSLYNSQVFPAIDFFYDFHRFTTTTESIKVIADTAATIYDATGPSGNTAIFTKGAGAGQAYFQGVGNTLYIGDGVEQKKWLQPALAWSAAATLTAGQWIIDSNNNIQQVTTGGITGGTVPTWNASVRGTTTDNGVTWTNRGNYVANWGVGIPPAITIAPATSPDIFKVRMWTANHTYGAGASNLYVIIDDINIMHVLQDGTKTTGANYPFTNNAPAFGGLTPDGTANWICIGGMVPQTGFNFSIASTTIKYGTIIDSNGNIQTTFTGGAVAGTGPPVWGTTVGATVVDGTVTWTCLGSANQMAFKGWKYAAAFHTVDGAYGTATPRVFSGPVMGAGPLSIIVSGTGSAEAQIDSVYIFRTSDDGATPLFLGSVANPGASGWSFTDALPDTSLNILIQADVVGTNTPPPAGLIALAYHFSRIWGAVGNVVYRSAVQSATTPAPLQGFAPLDSFTFPSKITRLVPMASYGLLVHTVSDLYVIGGDGTVNKPFKDAPFIPGIGLLSYNALDVAGGIIYLLASDGKAIALDPNAGVSRIGFPIEDLLQLYNPSTAYVAWHSFGQDEGLHVCDGAASWYRNNPTPAPESGASWSPKRTIQGGVKAVQSIETSPGVHNLLAWQASTGQIMKRDLSVFTDNGSTYACNGTIGSITLAQPGQLAEVSFISTDSMAAGTRVKVSVLLNEISGTFEPLSLTPLVNEPPLLPASTTLFSNRYYLISDQEPVWCRHMQIDFAWPAEAAANELLTYTIFGAHHQEV